MKKVNSKQVFSYVALAGFLAVALFYVLFYMKYEEKTAAIRQENELLKNKTATLNMYQKNEEKYRTEIEAMENGINGMLDEYPANAMEEDAIMLSVDMEKHGDIKYSVNSVFHSFYLCPVLLFVFLIHI